MSGDAAIISAATGWMSANVRLCIVSTCGAMVAHAAVAWHGMPDGATSRADREDTALTREILVYTSWSRVAMLPSSLLRQAG